MVRRSIGRRVCIGAITVIAVLCGIRMLYWRVFVPRIVVTNVGQVRMSDVRIEYDDGRRRVVERVSDIEPAGSITIAVDCGDLTFVGIAYDIEGVVDGPHRYEVSDLATPLETARLLCNEYGPVRTMGPPWPGAPHLHRTVDQDTGQSTTRQR